MAWIGLLGSKAVAGIGVGGMFTWLSQGFASMARMGGQVQVAQCVGRGDKEKAHGYAQAAVQLATVMGLVYALVVLIFTKQMIGFFKLEDPEACRRLTETFYESMDADTDIECGYLPPEKFAYALLDAYKNRDLTALLMAICQNSMFDLLRNSFLAPFRFNADGQENPVFLTDEKGNFLREKGIHVSDRDYDRFRRIYREKQGVKMYLAYGYRKRHAYDEDTMEVEEYKMGEHIGVLLVYELPDSVREKETEAQAYAAVWDIMMAIQKKLPRAFVYYGQDSVEDGGKRYDGLGVFLPIHKFADRLEKMIGIADEIVMK